MLAKTHTPALIGSGGELGKEYIQVYATAEDLKTIAALLKELDISTADREAAWEAKVGQRVTLDGYAMRTSRALFTCIPIARSPRIVSGSPATFCPTCGAASRSSSRSPAR